MENSYNYRLGKTSALCRYIHVPTIPSTRESTSSKKQYSEHHIYNCGYMFNCCLCKVQHPTYLAAAELRLYPGNPKWNCLNQLYELSPDNQELRSCAVPRDLNTMNRDTGRWAAGRCVGTHLNIVANNRPEL